MNFTLLKPKPPIWNLWHDGVTQSLIQKWLQCPKQCELEYYWGWTPTKQNEGITFGNIIHYVLEQAYWKKTNNPSNKIESWLFYYKEKQDEKIQLSSDDYGIREVIYAKASALLRAYFFYFAKDFEYKWWFIEEKFKVNGPSGTGIKLNGMIDGIFSKTASIDNLYLMDHKFLSVINVDTLDLLLPSDFQINFYLYCARKILASWYPKSKIKGFYYNVVRRPGLKFTKKDGNLKVYEERVFQDILERPHHYFCSERHQENNERDPFFIPVADEEIDQFEEKQLRPILNDITWWWENDLAYPKYYNPLALESKYGLASMAKAILYKDFSGLYQRNTPFAELEE